MPGFIAGYVRIVERINRVVGRTVMYMIFAMVGVLFYSSVSKEFGNPALWTLDTAQFLMVAYFILGGAYTMQLDGHVRMDLFYGTFTERAKSRWDTVTVFCLIFYLVILLIGAVYSTIYAIQFQEVASGAWRPYMWPIKVVMTFGILLMLLQAIAQFFKDLAVARGVPLS
ncbi:MAG TPA: TRAP transporter small permease subunit [Methylomirabilota bacterium]|nr:TRAP transporter small permease subunit [Methylomirabilota bacterium]